MPASGTSRALCSRQVSAPASAGMPRAAIANRAENFRDLTGNLLLVEGITARVRLRFRSRVVAFENSGSDHPRLPARERKRGASEWILPSRILIARSQSSLVRAGVGHRALRRHHGDRESTRV